MWVPCVGLLLSTPWRVGGGVQCLQTDTHFATFSEADTRSIAYRWRPVVQTVDVGMPLVNTRALRRYTRAMIALNTRPVGHTFGICAISSHRISLFILARTETADEVRAILWTEEEQEYDRHATMRGLRTFHNHNFGSALPLQAGKELEWEDLRRF